MRKFKEYNITFPGLKQGKHEFDYTINDSFFALFDYEGFNSVHQNVHLTLDKKSNLMELVFTNQGTVNVDCDLSGEPFDLPVQGELYLVVKFGEEYNDENDEILILPHGEYEINVAHYIYELIVLSVPAKRVHPGVEDGSLQSETLSKLEELSPKEKEEQEDNIDPRWEELRKLLNKN